MRAEKRQRPILFWLLRLAVLAAVFCFVKSVPETLPSALTRNIHLDWFKPKESGFKGVIRLWNVYDSEKFDGSVLRSAVRRFERANRGAFVEYITIDIETAKKKLENSLPPDIWISPKGNDFGDERLGVVELPPVTEDNIISDDFEFDAETPGGETAPVIPNRIFWVSSSCEVEKASPVRLLFESIASEDAVAK